MNFQNNRYTLRFAEETDAPGIRAIYESGVFPGNLSVRYLRNPDPVKSFQADCDKSRIMVIEDNEKQVLAAVGGAVLRKEYVQGKLCTNAYLTGLKIHANYQKKIFFIAKSYEFLREGLGDVDYCYTTILDDNEPAIRMLEKKHKNMPTYKYLGHYTTYCFDDGKAILPVKCVDSFELFPVKCVDSTEASSVKCVDFSELQALEQVRAELIMRDFLPASCKHMGFGEKTFYYLMDEEGVAACCYVGNQQGTKQYEVSSYGGIYKTLSKLPTKLLGYPAFPKEGTQVNHGVVSYLYVRNQDKKLCRKFLRTVTKLSGFDLMIWGCFENHPLKPCLDAMKTVHYGSRLYEVQWGEWQDHDFGTIGVEAALL